MRIARVSERTMLLWKEKPEKKIYKLNQAELDAFLEGYNEYAEFIVELKKIDEIGK